MKKTMVCISLLFLSSMLLDACGNKKNSSIGSNISDSSNSNLISTTTSNSSISSIDNSSSSLVSSSSREQIVLTTVTGLIYDHENNMITWNDVADEKEYKVEIKENNIIFLNTKLPANTTEMDVSSLVAGNYIFEIIAIAESDGLFLDSLPARIEFTVIQKVSYTISYNAMGGTIVESVIIISGEKITNNPSTSRIGYTFDGWFKEKEGINEWNFAEDTVLAEITLYAHWTGTEGLIYKSIKNDTEYEVRGFVGITGEVYLQEYYNGKPVTHVGNSAFSKYEITLIQFANTITYIDNWAFENCEFLDEIIFHEGIKYIGQGAFNNTLWLDNQPDGEVYIEKIFYKLKGIAPESIIIKNDTVAIADEAFYFCTTLKNITLSDGLETIGANAFSFCTNLIGLQIPASVTFIGDKSFYNCISLAYINVDEANAAYCSINSWLYTKDLTTLICCPTNYNGVFVLPESLLYIGIYAFFKNINLVSIIIPEQVKQIGDEAFLGCFNLKEILIPDSVISIGEQAFSYCEQLKKVSLGAGLEEMGYDTFIYCLMIETVIINRPSSAGIILFQNGMFNYCYFLRNIYFLDEASLNTYKTANGWSSYANLMSINPH